MCWTFHRVSLRYRDMKYIYFLKCYIWLFLTLIMSLFNSSLSVIGSIRFSNILEVKDTLSLSLQFLIVSD